MENKDTLKRSRNWTFTFNGYNANNVTQITQTFSKQLYVFQEETGATGTKHLQGLLRFKDAKTFKTVTKMLGGTAHIEVCRNVRASEIYCTKEETRTGKIYTNYFKFKVGLKDPMKGLVPYAWQTDILELIKGDADYRSINWYWEATGCAGKTTLAKSICIRHKDAIYVSGKASDIKYAICSMKTKPRIVIWDIPRSLEEYVSWDSIESIKNGIFFSGKYEGGMCIFDPPHIVVFSNFEPDRTKLSMDRWNINAINPPPQAPPI